MARRLMRLRRVGLALGLAVVGTALALLGILTSATSVATAAPATSTSMFSPPREVSKVTLADTSIDGPAFWVGAREGAQWEVLAWTGTDAAHHLNVMTSTDGVHYSNKRILPETAIARPAVTVTDDKRVVLAWTGTDAHHSLNILYDVYGASPQKLTLWNENSFAGPGIAVIATDVPEGSKVYLELAWAGTDSNHTLNTLRVDVAAGLTRDVKVTLPAQYNSAVGPWLGSDHTGAQFTSEGAPLLLTWAYRTPVNRMDALVSFNGVQWYTVPEAFAVAFPNQPSPHPPLPREWSDATPSMQAFVLRVASDGAQAPLTVWAWRGIDAAHSVNVMADVLSINGSPQKTTLAETALGGPAVGGNVTLPVREILVAWTGTDAQHHLNIARIAV